ncbi:MAG: hypothetical protein QOD66_2046 [Solirubrobacteraceae bacterium]|nr:hypothetical protein [Solirubrobacteraceae bacterium]
MRLPRDWLGPREELVPFGPSADAAAPPPSASDFWGEQSAALQHALQGPEPDSAIVAPGSPDQPGRENERSVRFLDQARRAGRRLASAARGRWKAVAALGVTALAAAVVIVASADQTTRIGTSIAQDGSRFARTVLATAATGVRLPRVGRSLTASRRAVARHRESVRAHQTLSTHRRRPTSTVQVDTVSHNRTAEPTALPSSVAYGSQAGSGSSYVARPATSSPAAATSAASTSASSQGQPAGPTGPGAILGPGHCSC